MVNATGALIADYQLIVQLPPGRLVRTLAFTAPASGERPGVAPATPDTVDGRRAVRLELVAVPPAEAATLDIGIGHERRPPIVAIVAVLIAAVYLVAFRDVPSGAK